MTSNTSVTTKSAMKMILLASILTTAVAGTLVIGGQYALAGDGLGKKHRPGFTTNFFLENCTSFASTGSNTYFILEPGYQLVLETPDAEGDEEEEGEGATEQEDGDETEEGEESEVELIITVLDETKMINGVETRVVEERESEGEELVEVSRNYFAICEDTNSVFYFGEDVDDYENGEIVSHDGAWLAGKDGAKAGLMMPGIALLGAKYFQEIAPGVAMDKAQIVSMDNTLETEAGSFENVLKIKETTPLEPGVIEFKLHAPGIGLIQDSDLVLDEYGYNIEELDGEE